MGKKSIDKGRRGEREVVGILRRWWGGEPWGRRGLGHRGGDLVTPPDFPFHIEVKNGYRGIRYRHLVYMERDLPKWWKQVAGTCPEGKRPLLVVKAEGRWWTISERVMAEGAHGYNVRHGLFVESLGDVARALSLKRPGNTLSMACGK